MLSILQHDSLFHSGSIFINFPVALYVAVMRHYLQYTSTGFSFNGPIAHLAFSRAIDGTSGQIKHGLLSRK